MHNQMRPRISNRPFVLSLLVTALLGCQSRPAESVGSNVGTKQQPLAVDKVDILLVVDDSASMRDFQAEELPRLIQAFVSGEDPEVGELPEISNVHVAVTSTDLGIGAERWTGTGSAEAPHHCEGRGDDGLFIELDSTDLERCMADYPNYLSIDNGTSMLVTTTSLACLPALGSEGCGFEQPLEAALKALWPADDDRITFVVGEGHGAGANAGFLREDSLLIVVMVTNEDDCSSPDEGLFQPPNVLDPNDPLATVDLNVRCSVGKDRLYPTERYVDALKALRPDNDHVVFVAIGGVPHYLVTNARDEVDFSDAEARDAYYESLLQHPQMQERIMNTDVYGDPVPAHLEPSCVTTNYRAMPPRRLVQVAKQFGEYGVLGSLCSADFGAVTGRIIRAAVDRIQP